MSRNVKKVMAEYTTEKEIWSLVENITTEIEELRDLGETACKSNKKGDKCHKKIHFRRK